MNVCNYYAKQEKLDIFMQKWTNNSLTWTTKLNKRSLYEKVLIEIENTWKFKGRNKTNHKLQSNCDSKFERQRFKGH